MLKLDNKSILEALETINKFSSSFLIKKPILLDRYPDSKLFDFQEQDKYREEYVFSLNEKIAILFYADKFYDYNDYPEISNERIDFWFSLLDRRKYYKQRSEQLTKSLEKIKFQENWSEEWRKIVDQWKEDYRQYVVGQDDFFITNSFHPEIKIYFQFLATNDFDLLDVYKESGGRFKSHLFVNFREPLDVLFDSINYYIFFSEMEEYLEYHRPQKSPAIAMCNPIRQNRDYSPVGRKTFFDSNLEPNHLLLEYKLPFEIKIQTYTILVKKENVPEKFAYLFPPEVTFHPDRWMKELKKILKTSSVALEKQEKIVKILYFHLERLGKEQNVDMRNFQSPYQESYSSL